MKAALPRRRRTRLRTKLIVMSLLLWTFVGAGIATVSYLAMENYLISQLDSQLRRSLQGVTAESSVPQPLPQDTSALPNPLQAPGQGEGILMLHSVSGVVDTARSGWIDLNHQQHQLNSEDLSILRALPVGGSATSTDLGIGAYRLESVEAPDGSVVTVGLPLTQLDNTLYSLGLTLALVAAAGLITAGIASTMLIRSSLRPLERVSDIANGVADLELDSGTVELMARIEPSDNDTEVGRVGSALNRMLDNVAGALAARHESETRVRQFVADASHELRTPLTSIRGYSDLVVRTQNLDDDGMVSMERVRVQALRMQNLVDDLLLLARYDEGGELETNDVDLTQVVLDVASDAEITDASSARALGVQAHAWTISIPDDPLIISGDEGQLHRAVANLVSNARKHTDPGTPIRVTLRRQPDGAVLLHVADAGKGIRPDFLPHIFDRFTRADAARSGTVGTTGLGLPIVKAIVESHHGSLTVTSGPTGTDFSITLPGTSYPMNHAAPHSAKPTGGA